MKERTVQEDLQEELKDPYFRALYEVEHQKMTIIQPIIAYRNKHKLSQGELAKQVGVSQQHISKIENGEFSSVATLQKVLLHVGYTVKMEAIALDKKVKNRLKKQLLQKQEV